MLLFVGAMGKSAQLPLYVWLPDAMAGPTPVSALIHAATMVTAGVYMVARLYFLFALSPDRHGRWWPPSARSPRSSPPPSASSSTTSRRCWPTPRSRQLGFMFIGVGVGAYWAGIFHLLTHAFFKACALPRLGLA